MMGQTAVTDFRNTDSWNEARILVCVLLEISGHWSHRETCGDLAAAIERHSVSFLDGLAQAYTRNGITCDLGKAQRSLDELESLLQKVRRRGALDRDAVGTLNRRIGLVKRSLHLHRT
jgi:hypothetical protein